MHKEYAIIVAGGIGSRMSKEVPKQFLILNNIPVIFYSIKAFYDYSNNIEIIKAQINILLGIMFFFLAISPWASGLCIKISLQNK